MSNGKPTRFGVGCVFICLLSLLGIVLAPLPLLAQTSTPLARSIAREAARAAATPLSTTEIGGAPRPNTDSQADWSRVLRLEGDEIVLSLRGLPPATLHGSPSGRRTVVRASVAENGLTVLNLTDPAIPRVAKGALLRAASEHPEYFTPRGQSSTVRLDKRVRWQDGGLFVDDRPVIELERVVEQVDRSQVVEISRVHRATKRGAGWGALAGAGVALVTVFSSCGTHWNTETSSCGNLTGAVLVVYPVWGALVGAAVGAANEITTVVYRAP